MSLAFDEYGPAGVPTIVFLHGGGGGRWMWQPQVERLVDYHLLVPDLPGHGDSVDIRLTSILDAANRVADLIREKAHGRKAHIVGLSLGAQVAVCLLAQSSDLVDHAVISSALFKPLSINWLYHPSFLGFLYRLSVMPYRYNRRWAQVNMKYSAGIPPVYFPQFFKAFNNLTEDQFVDITRVGLNNRIPVELAQAHNPTLVLCGEKEYQEMKNSVREIAGTLSNGEAYQVHYPKGIPLREQQNWSMTYPELFTRTVRAWIEGQPLPGELQTL
jgi:pimeloyl-ACP methyl ester carboxylesterase